VDQWYEYIKEVTFQTEIIPITIEEAEVYVNVSEKN